MADIPDDVKRQANKVAEPIRDNVKEVEQTGTTTPVQTTPNPELGDKVGKKLNDMQKAGYEVDKINKELTKADFVRE